MAGSGEPGRGPRWTVDAVDLERLELSIEVFHPPADELALPGSLEEVLELALEKAQVLGEHRHLLNRTVVEIEAQAGELALAGLDQRALGRRVAREQRVALEDARRASGTASARKERQASRIPGSGRPDQRGEGLLPASDRAGRAAGAAGSGRCASPARSRRASCFAARDGAPLPTWRMHLTCSASSSVHSDAPCSGANAMSIASGTSTATVGGTVSNSGALSTSLASAIRDTPRTSWSSSARRAASCGRAANSTFMEPNSSAAATSSAVRVASVPEPPPSSTSRARALARLRACTNVRRSDQPKSANRRSSRRRSASAAPCVLLFLGVLEDTTDVAVWSTRHRCLDLVPDSHRNG